MRQTADMEHVSSCSLRMPRHPADGLGFVFTQADPFCGVDLDRCRDASGNVNAYALDLIRRFASYTEISPSGEGVHILVRAKLQGSGRRFGSIQMYDSGRYFTITGRHISGTQQVIQSRQELLDDLVARFASSATVSALPIFATALQASDYEIIERAKRARNGERFRRL